MSKATKGTIKQRGNALQIRIGWTDPDGNHRRINRTVKGTDPAAWKRAELVRAQVNHRLAEGLPLEDPEPVAAVDMTVEQLIARYLESNRDWAAKTKQTYAETLAKVSPLALADTKLIDVKRSTIRQALDDAAIAGASDSMVRRIHTLLHQLFAYAVFEDLIDSNPVAGVRKPKGQTKKQMRIEPFADIMAVISEQKDPWWRTLLHLTFATGMRREEVAALRWVDVGDDVVHVEHGLTGGGKSATLKRPKSESSVRDIPIDPQTARMLQRHRDRQVARARRYGAKWSLESFVFAPETFRRKAFNFNAQVPLRLDRISKLWENTARGTSLERMTFHDLRHSHATHLLADGQNLAELSRRLGHANPSVTLRIYSHAIIGGERKLADAFASLGAAGA